MPGGHFMPGILLVVSGPSGVGKGTVVGHMMESGAAGSTCRFSVSMTTRAPRPGEIHGVHYFFTDKESFLRDAERGMLLEYAEYNGNYYGTPSEYVKQGVNSGACIILDIETQGMRQTVEKMPEAVTVFIAPPGIEVLEKRLRGRGTETEDSILRRLDTARRECGRMGEYQYIIVNDDVQRAAQDLAAVIRAEYLKSHRNMEVKEL